MATLEATAKYMTKMDAESGEYRTSFFAIFAVHNSAELIFFHIQFEVTELKTRQFFYQKILEEGHQFLHLLWAFLKIMSFLE